MHHSPKVIRSEIGPECFHHWDETRLRFSRADNVHPNNIDSLFTVCLENQDLVTENASLLSRDPISCIQDRQRLPGSQNGVQFEYRRCGS
jgi:hypothetical protein